MDTEPELRIEHTFASPRAKVFAAWSDPEVLRRWWGAGPDWTSPAVEVDLRPGGRYRLSMTDPAADAVHTVSGEYLDVSPPTRLVYTWTWEMPDAATTVVTVDFHETDHGTTVVLTHAGLPTAQERGRHEQGWRGCLANLDSRVLHGEQVKP